MFTHPIGAARKAAPAAYSRIATALALIIGAFVVATTWYGVHHFYSPIPWWDEWDGYVGFYRSVIEGAGPRVWFDQHVNHRIFTSRVLFWLDLKYLHGNHIVLFLAQQVMLASIVALLVGAARRAQQNSWWVLGIAAAFMFSWVQSETLKWGFETQVIAAYFFSALSFYVFVHSESGPVRRFVASFTLAALAEYSMGNGIAAPACLVALSIITRRSAKEMVAIAVAAAVLIGIYFIGYHNPPTDMVPLPGSLLKHQVAFLLAFMGNPLSPLGFPVSACIGVGVVILVVGAAVSLWVFLSGKVTPYRALLVGIFLFVVASALAAASGRGLGGAAAALASRYTTGPLLGCVVLLMLLAESFAVPIAVLATVAALVIVSGQTQAFADNGYLYGWKLGLLSTKIGLEHTEYSGQLFPATPEGVHRRFQDYAAYSAEHHIGVYQRQWLIDAGAVKFDPSKVTTSCQGNVDRIESDREGLAVSGWADPAQRQDVLIVLTDADGDTIGYGITGQRRDDVEKAIAGAPGDAGWVGFAVRTAGPISAYAYAGGTFCKLPNSATTP